METIKEAHWSELKGMSENKAEEYMMREWGRIPPEWLDPIFRDEILGMIGASELSAHMNWGEQAYGGDSRLGSDARRIWFERNFANQGHPGVKGWVEREKES